MIDIYDNKYFINNKKCSIATIWLMILIIFLLIFLNISFNYKYKKYEQTLGYIKKVEDDFKVVIYVLDEEVSSLLKYDIVVDGFKYEFEIEDISEEFYLINNLKHKEIILDIDLDKKLLIENNVINITIEKGYETLFIKLKKGIEKWIN